ncbi:MAG TPA: polysaccharide biosynthesis protein [Cyanobacteria bacterium UBA8553]|nr:polysaccharide biosynthesis protein [Cyanobacteria bacterium UBA8553]HAJ60322.1 polysaccharide biosynthesis protein [Cyanobacteria bacterium UBA8543]
MNRISLLKSGFWTTYGAIATRLLALVSNLLLARLLSPSAFGVIAVAYIFWGFVNLFTQDSAGSYIVFKGLEDKRYLNTSYTISLGIGLVLAIALVAISPLAAKFFGVPNLVGILAVFAFNLLLSCANSVYRGVLTRRMQYRELANSDLIASMVRVFSTAGCAFLGLSYWSFVVGDTAFWLTSCILLRHHAKQDFRLEIYPEARKEVMAYCLGSTGSSLGYYVNANCDNFVIGRMLGSTSLGFYNFAYQLTMALTTILGQAIGQIGMSAFAQLPDDKQQENALLRVVEQIAFLSAPLYALFFLIIDQRVISLVFGVKWVPACAVIPWLLIFAYFRLINNQMGCMLSAKGRPGVNARVNLYIAPLAVVGFLIGAWQGGIVGVSIAVAVVLGFLWTVYWWWVGCRELRWPLIQFLIPSFKAALIALIGILISLAISTSVSTSVSIILEPVLFIGIYLVCVRILAAKQFFDYLFLVKKLSHRVAQIRKSK